MFEPSTFLPRKSPWGGDYCSSHVTVYVDLGLEHSQFRPHILKLYATWFAFAFVAFSQCNLLWALMTQC